MTLGSLPQHFVGPPWVRHIVRGHSEAENAPVPLPELPLPAWKPRVLFTVTPAALALPYLAAGGQVVAGEAWNLEAACSNGISQHYLQKAETLSPEVGNRK